LALLRDILRHGKNNKAKGRIKMDFKGLLLDILIRLLKYMTPELRRSLCLLLKDWHERCKQTENPIDDVVSELLLDLLACENE